MICIISRGDGISPQQKTKKKVRKKIIMKRILAVLLAVTMAFGLVACNKGGNNPTGGDTATIKPEFEAGTAGETLWNGFLAAVTENEKATVEDIANELVSNEIIEFAGGTENVEPGWLAGFKTEISGFEKGAKFGPIIGSIPFVGYIFELAEDADVNAFIKTLKEQSNPRWNVCTEADYTQVGAYDNKVYFLMYPADIFSESANNAGDGAGEAVIVAPDAAEGSWGETLWNEFVAIMNDTPKPNVAEIAFSVVMHESIPFTGGAAEMEAGMLAGFTEEMTGFNKVAMFGPEFSSMPFIGYVFELEEGADVNAFVNTLKEKSDTRWMVCTEAEQKVVGAYNNYVFFLMCNLSSSANAE